MFNLKIVSIIVLGFIVFSLALYHLNRKLIRLEFQTEGKYKKDIVHMIDYGH